MKAALARNLVAAAVIAVAVIVCYENSLDGEFMFDDNNFIVENPNVRGFSVGSPQEIVSSIGYVVKYNPFRCVLSTTFGLHYAAVHRAEKDDPGFVPDTRPFHIVNTLIHLANAVLVFFLAKIVAGWTDGRRKWKRPYFIGLGAALLFATASVGTEAVSYLVGRSNSLCTLLLLAGALAFLKARRIQEERYESGKEAGRITLSWTLLVLPVAFLVHRILMTNGVASNIALAIGGGIVGLWVLATALLLVVRAGKFQVRGDLMILAAYFFFGLAALTKELAIVLPLLLLVLDALVLSGGRRGYMKRRWKYHAAMLGTVLLMVFLRMAVIASVPPQAAEQWEGEGLKFDAGYLATQVSGPVMTGYLKQFFLPTELNFDSDVPIMTAQEAAGAANLLTVHLLALLLILFLTIWIARRARLFAAGMLWYFIALAPTSSVLRLSDAMDEGRMYLSLVGLCLAICAAVAACFGALKASGARAVVRIACVAMLAAVITLNVVHTRSRNEDYASARRMWYDTVMKGPMKARAHEGLGRQYMNIVPQTLMRFHIDKATALGRYLPKVRRGFDDDVIAAGEETYTGRAEAIRGLMDEQRRYLYAAVTMFETSRELQEGGVPLSASDRAGIAPELQSSSTNFSLNLGVCYAIRGKALHLEAQWAAETGADKTRAERAMLECRYAAMGIFEPLIQFYPSLHLLCDSAFLYSDMADYYYETKKYSLYETYALRSEDLVIRALARNNRCHRAIILGKLIIGNLAQYYDPDNTERSGRKDPAKALAQYMNLRIILILETQIYGASSDNLEYSAIEERINDLKERIGD